MTWARFKAALGAMDKATARSLLSTESDLHPFVDAWTAADAAIVDQWLPPIRLVKVYSQGDIAICEAIRVTAGILQSYTVHFLRDGDGVWRLLSMWTGAGDRAMRHWIVGILFSLAASAPAAGYDLETHMEMIRLTAQGENVEGGSVPDHGGGIAPLVAAIGTLSVFVSWQSPRGPVGASREDVRQVLDDVRLQGAVDPDEQARQATWSAFKDVIRRGDHRGALALASVYSATRQFIIDFLSHLTANDRANIDAILPPITLTEVSPTGYFAYYSADKITAGVPTSHNVTFVREDGVWRIYDF